MSEYIIEKDIPYPQPIRESKKYPFHEMDVGDSFSVSKQDRNKVLTNSQYWGLRLGRKFSVRKWEGEINGEWKEGYRCWRIE